jgi:signal transduction histidine kinase
MVDALQLHDALLSDLISVSHHHDRKIECVGSGLGLSIVHALVQQSQGEIQIESGPDRGTAVAITLPRLTKTKPADLQLASA